MDKIHKNYIDKDILLSLNKDQLCNRKKYLNC